MLAKLRNRADPKDLIAAGLKLPPQPAELVMAENTLAKLEADKSAADADFNTLNCQFNVIPLKRVDGTFFASGGRDEQLVELFRLRDALAGQLEQARRDRDALRRKAGDDAITHTQPAIDSLCELMLDKLDELEELAGLHATMKAEAAAQRLFVHHRRTAQIGHFVHELQRFRSSMGGRP